MKKLLYILISIISIVLLFYITVYKDYILGKDENKVYEIINQETIEIDSLLFTNLFNQYIITNNEKKIIFINFNGEIIYERNNSVFSDKLFLTDKYLFRGLKDSIEIIDLNNKSFILVEVIGEILNVSRENNKTYIITKQKNGQNTLDALYILDENMELVVKNKHYIDKITSVAMSDKSEAYCLSTLNAGDGTINNTIYFNLLDDIELWNVVIENEVIIGTEIIKNNILAIGTENIYYYNLNGKLVWKIKNYNKINDYKLNKETEKIYILQNDGTELISYDLDGKVNEIYKTSENVRYLKVLNKNIFLYDDNTIYMLKNNSLHKLFNSGSLKIEDFYVESQNIYIVFNNKFIKGKIK
ncbi:MAG: hypothetical protein K0Q97_16 [Bacillota bacterium]|jgi:hypothetical protein|nr:hypothetical protein [Bacillota bacterium]